MTPANGTHPADHSSAASPVGRFPVGRSPVSRSSVGRSSVSRRDALGGALGAAAALGAGGLLAACGPSSSSDSSNGGTDTDGGSGGGTGSTGTGTGGGSALGKTVAVADVPVGSGIIDGSVVVTQPTAGTFKAFDATCTHQQCYVARIQGTQIQCPCHGSIYSTTDGSVIQGPAVQPLHPLTATVNGDTISIS